jgi:hypothetical protein
MSSFTQYPTLCHNVLNVKKVVAGMNIDPEEQTTFINKHI